MKVLKISISGYKLLEDHFDIDFLNKARISSSDKEDEIIELLDNLYLPTTTVFTGKNSSGKSSVLSLLEFVTQLLRTGRIKYNKLDFRNDTINLSVYFNLNEIIYRYDAEVIAPKNSVLNESSYCKFKNEKLFYKKYSKSYGKNILLEKFDQDDTYSSNVDDTSILYQLTSNKLLVINSNQWINDGGVERIFDLFHSFGIPNGLMLKIVNLFDESITYFDYDLEKKLYFLELKGIGKNSYSQIEIERILSQGTKKGLIMMALTIAILKIGDTMIIDEIENSFHKNLVENIIMIFNDKRINKNKANLIFSTHYVEILDIFRRRDNIFIMDKEEFITNKNMYEDYKDRIELSKSNQFNNNTFKTLINYDRLMDLKHELIHEIPLITGR